MEITTRKFPNLILYELLDRNFIFSNPRIQTEKDTVTDKQLNKIYDYVNRRMGDELRRYR